MTENRFTDLERMRQHIEVLTRVARPCHSPELEAARRYVTDELEACGWTVRRHVFETVNDCGDLNYGETLHGINLISTRDDLFPADQPDAPPRPRLCVGAHLDSRPDTPGADDNASGVAVLLEVARLLSADWLRAAPVDLELVAFDLEENGMLGGREHARVARDSATDLLGMISLEMLGYCDHRSGSQSLPRSLIGIYPDTANFIAVIGNQNSAALVAGFREGAVQVTDLPVETLQVPSNGDYLQATRLSDHSPFWDAGYAALMITDTSFMRNPHYHQATDTIDTLDLDFLQRVADGCLLGVRRLLRGTLSP